jgi:hypothetical protein
MTPQEKVLLLGAGAGAVAKFYFGKSWIMAGVIGLAAISAYALLTASVNPATPTTTSA